MSVVVFKYPLEFTPAEREIAVALPVGATILSVQFQQRPVVAWVLCTPPTAPVEERWHRFRLAITGEEIDDSEPLTHLATLQADGEVWHIFEVDASSHWGYTPARASKNKG